MGIAFIIAQNLSLKGRVRCHLLRVFWHRVSITNCMSSSVPTELKTKFHPDSEMKTGALRQNFFYQSQASEKAFLNAL